MITNIEGVMYADQETSGDPNNFLGVIFLISTFVIISNKASAFRN